MPVLIHAVTAAADVLLAPLGRLPPFAGLAIASLITAAVALIVIKRTSDQTRIRAAKDGMYGALLEMRLFNDDLRAIMRAQVDVFRFNARYLRAALAPIVWLIVPLALFLSQLETFYEYQGLSLHEPALVTAHVRTDAALAGRSATLVVPAGIHADAPAVWFPATGDLVWRIVPVAPTVAFVTVRTSTEEFAKTVVVSDGVGRRSPVRLATGDWSAILEHPSEMPLPDSSPFDRITVDYPARVWAIAGWHLPWWVWFGVFTLIFGLVLSRLFGVEV